MLKENLKTIRKAKGLSQEELAIKLNVVRQTISKWEQGLSVPDSEMLTKITQIGRDKPELLEIYCHAVSDEVREIVAFVKSRQGQITGAIEDRQYEIPITDIFYIESVDNKVFIYTQNRVYETKQKLYELEEILKEKRFLRISKSTLRNLMKVSSIKPALNGRFTAVLYSGEQTIISRKYVPELKKALKGDS